jgi:hypothetical protein
VSIIGVLLSEDRARGGGVMMNGREHSWCATDPGAVVLCSRAYSHDGATQPEFGRRNAIHRIEVKVV